MATAAIVAGAPIVLFPSENALEAAPPPAAGSSEVTQVTMPPPVEDVAVDDQAPGQGAGPAPVGSAGATSVLSGPGSGSLAPSGPPLVRSPASQRPPPDQEGPSGRPGDEGKDDKSKKGKKGKAKGHDKANGKGNAKGHDKWHGNNSQGGKPKPKPAVAFSPSGGKKHDHVKHSGAGKHGDRGRRPNARSRS